MRNKLVKANKSLYIIRSLRKEGCKQPEIDHLFRSIVLPNITYALTVYGAAGPELTTAQNFLDRCFKRKYVSERIDIHQLLEKQDKRIFNKVSSMHSHPLRPLIPKAKKTQYCLRSKSAVRPPINTDRCKQTYINRLIFKYNLSI